MIRAVKSGQYSGGIIAYGYRLNPDTKRLEIENNEAEVVRQIFEWCVEERISCVQIAERLNTLDIQRDTKKMVGYCARKANAALKKQLENGQQAGYEI